MPLKVSMSKVEMQSYLIDDLRQSAVNDILPTLQPNRREGGYFSVPRLVLSYVDYLGVLYNGYEELRDRKGRRIFAKTKYAIRFLEDVFGSVDSGYVRNGKLLWDMYRHGTVHLYQPFVLTNGGQVISWSLYKGNRASKVSVQGIGPIVDVVHLEPKLVAVNQWMLPVSITCLYEDLLAAIEEYSKRLGASLVLETNFRQVADALQIPEFTDITW